MADERYYEGTGRRKTAVARVRLYPGQSDVSVNGKTLAEMLPRPSHQRQALLPLEVTEQSGKFGAQVKVAGGGITGWAGAISHGIARALVTVDESNRRILRKNGLLTRDPRMKERKKYGLKRARKAPQYTKR